MGVASADATLTLLCMASPHIHVHTLTPIDTHTLTLHLPSHTHIHTHTLVTDPPSSPTILGAVATSSTTVTLQWTPITDDGGSPLTNYIIEYRLMDEAEFDSITILPDTLSATITGLAPYGQYEVQVRGENAVGHGEPSISLSVQTHPDGEEFRLTLCVCSPYHPHTTHTLLTPHTHTLTHSHCSPQHSSQFPSDLFLLLLPLPGMGAARPPQWSPGAVPAGVWPTRELY